MSDTINKTVNEKLMNRWKAAGLSIEQIDIREKIMDDVENMYINIMEKSELNESGYVFIYSMIAATFLRASFAAMNNLVTTSLEAEGVELETHAGRVLHDDLMRDLTAAVEAMISHEIQAVAPLRVTFTADTQSPMPKEVDVGMEDGGFDPSEGSGGDRGVA